MAETWNEATPPGSETPQLGDDRIREFKRAVRERLAQDHDFEAIESPAFGQAGATIGMHRKVTLVEQASGATTGDNQAAIYTKDDGSGNTEIFLRGPNNGVEYQLTDENCTALNRDLIFGRVSLKRAWFSFNGWVTPYTITLKNGRYAVQDKIANISAEVITAAISAPASRTWYYLYLDYAAITSGVQITASELFWSTTAPTYDDAHGGWYSGDDLCIMAARTNIGDNLNEFFHDGGDLLMWADVQSTGNNTAAGWTDFDLSKGMPGFSRRAPVMFSMNLSAVYGGSAWWRTKGQSSIKGHEIFDIDKDPVADPGALNKKRTILVMTDSAQMIECKRDDDVGGLYASVDGWYFPVGM